MKNRLKYFGTCLVLGYSFHATAQIEPTRLLLYRGATPRPGIMGLLVQERLGKIHPIECDRTSLPKDASEAGIFFKNHCREDQVDEAETSAVIFKAFFNRKSRRFILSETSNGVSHENQNDGVTSTVAIQTIDLARPDAVVMNYTVMHQPLAGNSVIRSGHFSGFKVGDFTIDAEAIADAVTALP